eukprot:tig00000403_g280.t1
MADDAFPLLSDGSRFWQVMRGAREPAASGLNAAGHLGTVRAAVCVVGALVCQAQELCAGAGAPAADELNGLAFTATVSLAALLDSVAHYCERAQPRGPYRHDGNIYFASYPFAQSDFRFVAEARARLGELAFAGKPFATLVNELKHHCPHVGQPSLFGRTGHYDLHDGTGRGYVYDVLVPAYRIARDTVARLAALSPPPPGFPHP